MLQVHVGDTITFTSIVSEPHDVFIYGGHSVPPLIVPSPTAGEGLIINPELAFPAPVANPWMGGFAISPLFAGPTHQWNLTVGAAGTYNYTCAVHYPGMQAVLEVLPVTSAIAIPSPAEVSKMVKAQIAALEKKAAKVFAKLNKKASMSKPKKNSDGTKTHTVWVGGSAANHVIDFVWFFPHKITVGPSDTVVFQFSLTNDAPHVIAFLNGAPEPELLLVKPQASGPPHLQFNPSIAFPSGGAPTGPVSRTGIWNSGLISPFDATTGAPSNVTIKLDNVAKGSMPYVCALHYSSGMVGELIVK